MCPGVIQNVILYSSYCAQKLFLFLSYPAAGTLCEGMLPWTFLKSLCPDSFLLYTVWCLLQRLLVFAQAKGSSSVFWSFFLFWGFFLALERLQSAGLSCPGCLQVTAGGPAPVSQPRSRALSLVAALGLHQEPFIKTAFHH